MSRKAIKYIIGLMCLALLGIAVIQVYWIKWSVDLNEQNFSDRVVSALNQVEKSISENARTTRELKKNLKNLNKLQVDPLNEMFDPRYDSRTGRLTASKPDYLRYQDPGLLDEIPLDKLDEWIDRAFANQNIKTKFEYGIYNNSIKAFSIINGHHAITFDEDIQASQVSTESLLNSTEYSVNLFDLYGNSPGVLKVFFPHKTSYLWSEALPSMLTSLLFTGLILFCFAYAINIILTQKKVSEMKTDFINNMTHEFKTPIATISLAADSITSPMITSNEEKVTRFANIIKEENKRMLNQVEKVLQMAQLEKEEFQLKITDINIHDVIQQAVSNTKLKLDRSGGSISTQLMAQNPIIQGDLTHISNVVHNLLDNATKYSKDLPEIKIYTKNVKNGVQIAVEDHGIGMSAEAQNHIFEKFYRVHTGNLHDVKGFGLGLSYVKAIVDAHHGNISVKSELGKGSTFSIFFPFQFVTNKA